MTSRYEFFAFFFIATFATSALGESLPRPTKIRVQDRTQNSFRVTWENPPEQNYVTFTVKVFPEAVMEEPERPGQMSRSFSGLVPGERYTVMIQGFTARGFSSKVLKYEVWTVPEAPTGMILTPVQEISISISIMGIRTKFTALVDGMKVEWNDGTTEQQISGYKLEISPNEGVIVEPDEEEFVDKVEKIFTGLTPGEEYTVTLQSRVGPDHDPVYSSPISSTMRMPPAIPYSVEVTETEPSSVTLKTHGPIVGIHDDLQFVMTPKHGSIEEPSPDPNYPMFDLYPIYGLKPGTTYRTEVWAVSQSVRGFKPYVITFSTTPAPPLRIRVNDYDHYSVTLQWSHAHRFAESDEVQYLIEFNEVGGGKLQSATVKNFKLNSQVIVQVHKLTPGTVYEFRVFTILNGVKSNMPAEVKQTTIPKKPTISEFTLGKIRGVTMQFGEPKEGKCPSLKIIYSPSLNGKSVTPTFHKIGEEIVYEDIPTDGRYSIHVRCVSVGVEGPELVLSTLSEKADVEPDVEFDEPPRKKTILPCMPPPSSESKPHRPDTVAPDACCQNRPYHTAVKECCGEFLLDIGGDRLCCVDTVYNKRNSFCCGGRVLSQTDVNFKNGCPFKE